MESMGTSSIPTARNDLNHGTATNPHQTSSSRTNSTTSRYPVGRWTLNECFFVRKPAQPFVPRQDFSISVQKTEFKANTSEASTTFCHKPKINFHSFQGQTFNGFCPWFDPKGTQVLQNSIGFLQNGVQDRNYRVKRGSGYTITQLQLHSAQGCSYVRYCSFEMQVGENPPK